jgi:hypothetical protein
MKPVEQPFRMACGSDSVLAHLQRPWSDLWSSSYRPYRFLSVVVSALRLIPTAKDPQTQTSAYAETPPNQGIAHYNVDHLAPLMKDRTKLEHVAGHAADGCS